MNVELIERNSLLGKPKLNRKREAGKSLIKSTVQSLLVCALFSFLPSLIDIGSDAYLSWSFISGDNYTKHVPNEDYHTVQNCGKSVSRTLKEVRNGTDEGWKHHSTEYEFVCFEKDPIFGSITLFLIFLPGFMCVDYYYKELRLKHGPKHNDKTGVYVFKHILVLLLTCACIFTFPFQLILIKLICLFNKSDSMNKLSCEVSGREGLFESSLQVVFQLYIIFSKEDRQPSLVQLLTLGISVIMIVMTTLEAFFVDQPIREPYDYFKVALFAIPGSIFKIGTISIICTVLRFNIVFVVLITLGLLKCILMLPKVEEKSSFMIQKALIFHAVGLKKESNTIHVINENPDAQKDRVTTAGQCRNLFEANVFIFILYSILLLICLLLVNIDKNMVLPSMVFFDFNLYSYQLSTLPLVQVYPINVVSVLIWCSGFFSVIIMYHLLKRDFETGIQKL